MAESSNALNGTVASVQDREIIVKRQFRAPRELVFSAWTDPQQVPHWWGPQGFTITISHMDVRPGGVWSYVMHGPDGVDYDNKIVYIEVVRPERLVYSHGDNEVEEQFRVTVTFEEMGSQTEITMRSLFKSAEELEKVVREYGAVEGAKQTMERLAERVAVMVGQ
ncbi:ATPase [Paenibacillus sp. H1-7]|uniref:SRPBCC family protein n=1 Tax=Paenibacillus sp. H1-7 TaxID=2282849 RepID=UPI001EF857AB|nr:SRPBCC family protein [Paenibacillus sp. H1-7]ULL13722.1 ATPase [Paenibacillus sp. H1-7]